MKKLFLPAILIFALASCKKEDSCTLSATSIEGTYKVTSVKLNGTEVFNNSAFFDACERDDTYTLAANNVAVYTDAGVSCGGSSPLVDTWTLSGNTLTIAGEASTVTSFGCTQVVTTSSFGGGSEVITYVRQ
ncbi:MAG: lipocalin family protein [Bacteroidota bacterium]